MIPLPPADDHPPTNRRLNPRFDVDGEALILPPQFATAVRTAELQQRVGTLAHHHIAIIGAIDTLIGSY